MTTNYIRFVELDEQVSNVMEEAKAHNAEVWVNYSLKTTVISNTPVYDHIRVSSFSDRDLS
jgi:hypothetical protein